MQQPAVSTDQRPTHPSIKPAADYTISHVHNILTAASEEFNGGAVIDDVATNFPIFESSIRPRYHFPTACSSCRRPGGFANDTNGQSVHFMGRIKGCIIRSIYLKSSATELAATSLRLCPRQNGLKIQNFHAYCLRLGCGNPFGTSIDSDHVVRVG